jgi:hypothetical protein
MGRESGNLIRVWDDIHRECIVRKDEYNGIGATGIDAFASRISPCVTNHFHKNAGINNSNMSPAFLRCRDPKSTSEGAGHVWLLRSVDTIPT